MTTETTTAAASAEPSPSDEQEVRSWGWHLLQVSAWILVVMLPIHLAATWLVHDPGSFGVATFVDRWRTGPWRVFDWAFIVLALLHGGIGLNNILGSLTSSPRARAGVAIAVGVVFGVLGVGVSAAILRFVI